MVANAVRSMAGQFGSAWWTSKTTHSDLFTCLWQGWLVALWFGRTADVEWQFAYSQAGFKVQWQFFDAQALAMSLSYINNNNMGKRQRRRHARNILVQNRLDSRLKMMDNLPRCDELRGRPQG